MAAHQLHIDSKTNELKRVVIISSPKEGDLINVLDYGESTLKGFIDMANVDQMEFVDSTSSIGPKVLARDNLNEADID